MCALWDGEEQSVSRFDVGGKDIQKGLKGFIYGERGVWRPGDTLHISFILEDREKRIPDKHPVALEIYNPRGTVLHENDFNTRNERILYIRRSDTGNRPDRTLECVY